MLTSTLTAAGASKAKADSSHSHGPSSDSDSGASADSTAEPGVTDGAGGPAASSSAGANRAAASQAADVAPPIAAPAASTANTGLVESFELPGGLVGWAQWLPAAALTAALSAAFGKGSSKSSRSRTASSMGAAPLPSGILTLGKEATAVAPEASSNGGSAVHVPELLLANLQLLVDGLRDAGQHVAVLPVLQLARLVALTILGNQV